MSQNHTFVMINQNGTVTDLTTGRIQNNLSKTGSSLAYGEIGLSISGRLVVAGTSMGYIPNNDSETNNSEEEY